MGYGSWPTRMCAAAERPELPSGRRIATDLAVMLADGGEAIADPAVLRDQREVFDR
ncbi:hypothetical protein [Streptomyces virginiae]|uniref:hypothetical protein n=1 Tax=Streptomyces virginiae TaxID=1961 RepID=UPI00364C9E22